VAITVKYGGIQLTPNMMTTVWPISMVEDNVVPGMAFEPREMVGESFDHLDERVKELQDARGTIQRSFFHRAMRTVKVVNPNTGKKESVREPTGWTPTRKYENATGDLQRYIEGPFLDAPPLRATLPPFILYCPEQLDGVPMGEFNAHMGGEFHTFEHDPSKKFMLADGESRHLAIQRALSPTGKLAGSRREKLRNTLVTVVIIHGIDPSDMGQMFADLNGKGVTLGANDVAGLDIRDPWARAAKDIFGRLGVSLVTTGRQVSTVDQAEGKHLLVGQAITMVRALGTGSYSKATSSSTLDEAIKDPKAYDRVVAAGVQWFGVVLEHFSSVVSDGLPAAAIFTHPDYVLKSMPIKVALGVMGHAWVETNLPQQHEHRVALEKINWRVAPRWDGVAGKVRERTVTTKVDGKRVKVPVPEEYELAAGSAKMIGAVAVRALTNPSSKAGRLVRGMSTEDPDSDKESAA
jgi:DndB-like DNA-sulfur modification-associated protein